MSDRYLSFRSSIRSRLLVLTMGYVLIMAALVYVPTVSSFRQSFLEERLLAAQIAALALEEAPDNTVSMALEGRLLSTSGVITIIIRRQDRSVIMGFDRLPDETNAEYDLRSPSLKDLITGAIDTLDGDGNRMIRVQGQPVLPDVREVAIYLEENVLYRDMVAYSNNILILAVIISLFSGTLVYITLHWFLVRPMRRIRSSIVDFRQRPEDVGRTMKPSRRRDEIGVVERELGRMQEELRVALNQRAHLAELGEAVSRINHDLRNILATAQLASDALSGVEDPLLAKTSARIVSAIDRAISLCERTLRHGSAEEPDPIKQTQSLHTLVEDVKFSLGLETGPVILENEVDFDQQVWADHDQLFRVILNIARNAQQAQPEGGRIVISARQDPDGTVHTAIEDNGPGLSDAVKEKLFKPFVSAGRKGGTGLGLAISRDLVRAHGGLLEVSQSSDQGTTFLICLPGKNGNDLLK